MKIVHDFFYFMILAALLFACSSGGSTGNSMGDHDSTDSIDLAESDLFPENEEETSQGLLSASPEDVRFGAVVLGDTATETLTLTNDGEENLTISVVRTSEATTVEFSVQKMLQGEQSVDVPVVLVPGQKLAVELQYAPVDAGSDTGTLQIIGEGFQGNLLEISLFADEKGESALDVSPRLEFGYVGNIGEEETRALTIWNVPEDPQSNRTLQITKLELTAGSRDFDLDVDTCTASTLHPILIAPGHSHSCVVAFSPREAGELSGAMRVETNASEGETSGDIDLSGRCAPPETVLTLVVDPRGEPIPGAALRLWGEDAVLSTTDSRGRAVILPEDGGQIFAADGATSVKGVYSRQYKQVMSEDEVTVFVLETLPVEASQPVSQKQLSAANLEGARLEFSTDDVLLPNGSDSTLFMGEGHISAAPYDLPEGKELVRMFHFGPDGTTFSQPAKLTLPNTLELAPGERIEFHSFDESTLLWEKAAVLEVSPDGKMLETIEGGISHFSAGGIFQPDGSLPEYTVTGLVQDDLEQNLSDIHVFALGKRGRILEDDTNSEGRYTISGVRVACYHSPYLTVAASRSGSFLDDTLTSVVAEVSDDPSQTVQAPVLILPNNVVKGSVRGVALSPLGTPLEGARVTVYPSLGWDLVSRTDAEGRFVVSAVPAGAVQVEISHDGFGLFKEVSGTIPENGEWNLGEIILDETTDAMPPNVLWSMPANGQENLYGLETLRVMFDETLAPADLQSTLKRTLNDETVSGTATLENGTAVVFTPDAGFEDGRAYTFTLGAGLADLSGNTLGEDFVLQFRTVAPNCPDEECKSGIYLWETESCGFEPLENGTGCDVGGGPGSGECLEGECQEIVPDGDEEMDGDGEETEGDDTNFSCSEGVCVDSSTGFEWQQNPTGGEMLWSEALTYCRNLALDGEGWRMPDIDELRSVIVGCPDTGLSGNCNVRESDCLHSDCQDQDSCEGCTYGEGPSDSCYWPEVFEGTCGNYWSSNLIESWGGWFVGFETGSVSGSYTDVYSKNVRCVRTVSNASSEGFVPIVAGTFWMGSPDGSCPEGYPGDCTSEPWRESSEEELHKVTLTYDYELQAHEVTQWEWASMVLRNPSSFSTCDGENGVTCPVETISWFDTLAYANKLSIQAGFAPCYILSEVECGLGQTVDDYMDCFEEASDWIDSATVTLAGDATKPQECEGYRLPTEAEWEYAIRAGNQYTAFYQSEGNDGFITEPLWRNDPNMDQIGWYNYNSNTESGKITHPVGEKEANAWGLYDMSGNVCEWVWDWYQAEYQNDVGIDPVGPSSPNSYRVRRGGNLLEDARGCRSASRFSVAPGYRDSGIGFRLARSLHSDPCDPDPCNDHGTCNPTDGSCTCDNEFMTADCSDCREGYEGYPDCEETPIEPSFVSITAGTFWMGSPDGDCPAGYPGECINELGRASDREALHEVTLTYDFEMNVSEITQGQFEARMQWNPSDFGPNGEELACGNSCPVEMVSWYDALAYADELSLNAALTPCYVFENVQCVNGDNVGTEYRDCFGPRGGIESAVITLSGGASKLQECEGYRLPTEAEWEYAIRAGDQYTAYYQSEDNDGRITNLGCNDPNLGRIAWYCGNNGSSGTPEYGPKPVGGKDPNDWGLYDMSGNVYEWVWDWYRAEYQNDVSVDPVGPEIGTECVGRGGRWSNITSYCRSANRLKNEPSYRDNHIGFRLARTLHPESCTVDPCNGHGTCDDTGGYALCDCTTGYGGSDCSVCAEGYIGYPNCIPEAVDGDEEEAETEEDAEVDTTSGFVPITAGTFWMGSPDGDCPAGYPGECIDELGRDTDREELHEVTLTYDFEMQAHEMTQGEWFAAFGNNPSYFGPNGVGTNCGDDCPVERVNWYEVLAYANWLSTENGLEPCYTLTNCSGTLGDSCGYASTTCDSETYSCTVALNGVSKIQHCEGYRLPTEAEWEYAIRAGSNTAFYPSDGNDGTITETSYTIDPNMDQIGWYEGNSSDTTHPVGEKEANAWGLYDMSGNVWEWVWDLYQDDYEIDTDPDPVGPSLGTMRVIRGGFRNNHAQYCRSANRSKMNKSDSTSYAMGFRLVRTLHPDSCDPDPCNNHGSCDDTGGYALCNCNTGYDGGDCSVCAEGYIGYPNCIPEAVDGDEEEAETEEDAEVDTTSGFVPITAGTFWMGSPDGDCPAGYPGDCIDEPGRYTDEELHEVTLTYDFELQAHEVTQAEFAGVMSWNPVDTHNSDCRYGCGEDHPVKHVSWYDALVYANELSLDEGLTPCYTFSNVVCEDSSTQNSSYMACMNSTQKGIDDATVTLVDGASKPQDCEGYRLPTESEWEYAIRAGSQYTAFYTSDGNDGTITELDCGDPNLDQIAWYGYYCDNSRPFGTNPVGGKEGNAWGLYDMSGNVYEWTWDWYQSDYEADVETNPVGPSTGLYRVARGGYWYLDALASRSANRYGNLPGFRNHSIGFRLVRTLHGN